MPGDRFYSTPAWLALRKEVLIRDGYRCVLCGVSIAGYKQSRVDHVIPRKQRPDLALVLGNLRSLCVPCDLRHDAARPGSLGKAVALPVDTNGFPIGSEWQ